MLRNTIVTIGLMALSTIYLWVVAAFVPDRYALIVNFIIVPGLIGALAAYLLSGTLMAKLLFSLAIPVIHVAVFGGDPAKPGLENLLALVELVPLYVGCIVVHLLLSRRQPPKPIDA